jgi:hypothetical protein
MRTLKAIMAAVLVSAALISCSGEGSGSGGTNLNVNDLVLTFDKSVINSNGNDVVTFRAYYKGAEVSAADGARFFRIEGGRLTPLSSPTFSATEDGTYSFQAGYKTGFSDIVNISAISKPIPAAPADDPSGKSFVHRTFFNQHTGANCGFCPQMTALLKKTLADETVKDKVVLATLRNYSGEVGFANVPCPGGWPTLDIDYTETYPYNGTDQGLKDLINRRTATPAMVGISANPVYYEDEDIIVVKVAVKAAVDGEYNVGLWLMQDNFKKTQTINPGSTVEGWVEGPKNPYNYHNNGVRLAESKYLNSHVGYPLGKMTAGQTKEWIYVLNIKSKATQDLDGSGTIDHNDGTWWEGRSKVNLDDLHFAAFVTNTTDGKSYTVVNAIDFPYNTPAPFEYL